MKEKVSAAKEKIFKKAAEESKYIYSNKYSEVKKERATPAVSRNLIIYLFI